MTLIVAQPGIMWGDRKVSDGDSSTLITCPKIQRKATPFGPAIIGVAGDFTAVTVFVHTMDLPKVARKKLKDTDYYMHHVPTHWRTHLHKYNISKPDAEIVIVTAKQIWVYDNDLAACPVSRNIWCAGSGAEFAAGYTARQWVDKDLFAACAKHTHTVSAEFDVLYCEEP